jgi:hypothetical protein
VEDPWLENHSQLATELEALGSRACKGDPHAATVRLVFRFLIECCSNFQAPRLPFEDTWRDTRDLDYCFQIKMRNSA